jgi:hypothetical protein
MSHISQEAAEKMLASIHILPRTGILTALMSNRTRSDSGSSDSGSSEYDPANLRVAFMHYPRH